MLRLSPPGFERFLQSPLFVATFGGGEANVAVSLAQFGLDSHYVTRAAEARDRRRRGPRAARRRRAHRLHRPRRRSASASISPRPARASAPSTVIYDRARSAISEMAPDAVDWDERLRRRAWFHVTGITPALGRERRPRRPRRADRGARGRRRAGQRRSQLTARSSGPRAQAQAVMRPADARRRRRDRQRGGPAVGARRPRAGRRRHERAVESRRLPRRRRNGSRATSGRRWSPSRCARACRRATTAGAPCCGTRRPARCMQSQRYDVRLVDRIGGGDSFAAGLIYGLRHRPSRR